MKTLLLTTSGWFVTAGVVLGAVVMLNGGVSSKHHDLLGGNSTRIGTLCYWVHPDGTTTFDFDVPFC